MRSVIPTQRPGTPLLARDEAGDAVLMWHYEEELETEDIDYIAASSRVGAGPWSAPSTLWSSRNGGPAYSVLGMQLTGAATLIWQRFPPAGGAPVEESRQHPASGAWSAPERLAKTRGEADPPLLAVAPNGLLTLAFRDPASPTRRVLLERRAKGRWRKLAAPRFEGEEATIATDARGETILAGADSEHHRVLVLVLGADDRPEGPVQTFHAGAKEAVNLKLAADARGDAALVWRVTGDETRPLRGVTRSAGGRFTGLTTVAGGMNSDATLCMDAGGHAALVFANTVHGARALKLARNSAGRRWSARRVLAGAGQIYEPEIGALPGGSVLLAGYQAGTGPEAAIISPTGLLQERVQLSGPESGDPALAVSADGAATAAWWTPTGMETADYTP